MRREQRRNWPEMEICKRFRFSAAHYLPNVPNGHKCKQLHGHNYVVEVIIRGERNPNTGMVMDFGEIKERFGPVIKRIDHLCLNDIGGLENPTAENIALWIMEQASLKVAAAIRVWETPDCYAEAINHDGLYTGARRR